MILKTTRECYEIRARYEWANITLRCWDRGVPGDTYHCGEIVIYSSFGTWGNTWTACSVPFKRFLQGIDFDYAFTKFMGGHLREFDGEETLKELKRAVIRERRRGPLNRHEARAAWEAVTDLDQHIECGSESDYGYAMREIADTLRHAHPTHHGHPMRGYFIDPADWPRATRYNAQAVGFWRDIWPEFIEALKAEAPTA